MGQTENMGHKRKRKRKKGNCKKGGK